MSGALSSSWPVLQLDGCRVWCGGVSCPLGESKTTLVKFEAQGGRLAPYRKRQSNYEILAATLTFPTPAPVHTVCTELEWTGGLGSWGVFGLYNLYTCTMEYYSTIYYSVLARQAPALITDHTSVEGYV